VTSDRPSFPPINRIVTYAVLGAAYAYDALNRLLTVTVPGEAPTTYSYDAVGNLAGYTYPNGVATTYSYDGLNRLTQMGSAKGTPLSSYTYTLAAAGNRLTVAELSGRTVNYGYDSLYRLIVEAVTADPNQHNITNGYIYDAVGNRQQWLVNGTTVNTYTYDADDRLAADSYDAAGNTISSLGTANAYDFENHLIQRGGVSIVYDGDGNRVSETVAGATTQYLVDTLNPTGRSALPRIPNDLSACKSRGGHKGVIPHASQDVDSGDLNFRKQRWCTGIPSGQAPPSLIVAAG